jgi:ABC-type glycerol-3-phosphate transport system permease component
VGLLVVPLQMTLIPVLRLYNILHLSGTFPGIWLAHTVTIANLVNSLGGGWQLLTAAAFISMALPLVVFFNLQRYFVTGILAGSVKA